MVIFALGAFVYVSTTELPVFTETHVDRYAWPGILYLVIAAGTAIVGCAGFCAPNPHPAFIQPTCLSSLWTSWLACDR